MPDRYDPKFSVRPTGDRSAPEDSGGSEANPDDPLVELARIVSGRTTVESAPEQTEIENALEQSEEEPDVPESVPEPEEQSAPIEPQPLQSDAELAKDLEAELLNELQASFSSIPDIVGQPEPPPKPEPPPIPEETPAPSQWAPQDRSEPSPAEPEPPRVRADDQNKLSPPTPHRESFASRIARAVQGAEGEGEGASPSQQNYRPVAASTPMPAPKSIRSQRNNVDPDSDSVRSARTSALGPYPSEPVAPQPNQVVTQFDPFPEDEDQAPFDIGRFAPPGGGRAYPETEALPSEPYDFSEASPYATDEEGYFDETEDGQGFDTVPGYDDDDGLLPYPDDEYAQMDGGSSRRRTWIIGGLLGVVVVGGAALITLRSGGTDGPPPFITADASPTKITPDVSGTGESNGPAKLVYDRVDPDTEIADSRLVLPGSERIPDIPPIPGDGSAGDVSRIILNDGFSSDPSGDAVVPPAPPAPNGAGETIIASRDSSPVAPIGPKKVRTVVVRPDGTIVSNEATPAATPPDVNAGLPPASDTPPASAAAENPLLAENFGSTPSDSSNSGGFGDAPGSGSIPDIPAPPSVTPLVPRPSVPADTQTVIATTGGSNGPIDLTPGSVAPPAPTPAPTPPQTQTPAASGGGFLVQVSAQRSEQVARATFAELQRRHPSILAGREPNIQRADLGERGVYYRVRVGYSTREQAVQMCESLKAAGSDCLLASR